MNWRINNAMKRLAFPLLTALTLGGCAVYEPGYSSAYSSYGAYPYGQPGYYSNTPYYATAPVPLGLRFDSNRFDSNRHDRDGFRGDRHEFQGNRNGVRRHEVQENRDGTQRNRVQEGERRPRQGHKIRDDNERGNFVERAQQAPDASKGAAFNRRRAINPGDYGR